LFEIGFYLGFDGFETFKCTTFNISWRITDQNLLYIVFSILLLDNTDIMSHQVSS